VIDAIDKLLTDEDAEAQERAGRYLGVCSGCGGPGHRFVRCKDREIILSAIRAGTWEEPESVKAMWQRHRLGRYE
jgi:hypothetical protein